MSTFGDFFEAERARKAEADSTKREIEDAKRKEERDQKSALAKPMRDFADRLINQLSSDLKSKSIRVEINSHINLRNHYDNITSRSFRLMPSSLRSSKIPSIYCFNVYSNGSVSAEIIKSDSNSNGGRLFHKKADELSYSDFEEVARKAIEEVVGLIA